MLQQVLKENGVELDQVLKLIEELIEHGQSAALLEPEKLSASRARAPEQVRRQSAFVRSWSVRSIFCLRLIKRTGVYPREAVKYTLR